MKTFFVSSTFKDMQYERDAIHEITLPLLNALAKQYGQTVSFCDLRWGVNTLDLEKEEGMRKVMKVCLDEIDRCKPPLVVILGDCYGTIVKPEELVKATAKYKNFTLDNYELSATAIEIIYGALIDKRKDERTLFYFRDIENAPSMYRAEDSHHHEKLIELKEEISKNVVNPIHHYSVKWENNELVGVKEFAERLAYDLFDVMRQEWETTAALTPFERERTIQWGYIKDKGSIFSGREEILNGYIEKVEQGEKLIFIKGETGSGKSTLFSAAALKLQSLGWDVLPFIGGLTSESNDALDIIRNTIYYLENKLNLRHFSEERNTDGQELKVHTLEDWQSKLAELCFQYEKSGNKLIIMLDAVDQLFDDVIRNKLRFVPENLSKSIRFFITANESFETTGVNFYVLNKLGNNEVQSVVEGILSRYNRQLDKYVINDIKNKKEAANPLYLSLLIQRLLMMDKDDFFAIRKTGNGMKAISDYQREIIASCPPDTDTLCAIIIEEAAKRINPRTVNIAMQYIACSRFGLRQDDLAALLKDQWDALDFANFINYMNESFIMRDDGRFDFSHISIRQGVLSKCEDRRTINRELFDYFNALDEDDPIRQSEIIYHTIKADKQDFFIRYIGKNYRGDAVEAEEGCLAEAAKCIYDSVREDGGNWICKAINKAPIEENTVKFVKFLNTVLMPMMVNRQTDIVIGSIIQREVCSLTKKLVENNFPDSMIADITAEIMNAGYMVLADAKNKISVIEKAIVEGIQNIRMLAESEKTREVRKVLCHFYLLAYEMYLSMSDRKHILQAIDFVKEAFTVSNESGETYPESKQYTMLANAYVNLNDSALWPEAVGCLNKARATVREDDINGQINISYIFGLYYFAKGGIDNLNLALAENEKAIGIAHSAYAKKGEIDLLVLEINCRNNFIKALMESGSHTNLERAIEESKINLKLSNQLNEDLGTVSIKRLVNLITVNTALIYQYLGGNEATAKAVDYFRDAMQLSREIVGMADTPYTKLDMLNNQMLIVKNLIIVSPASGHDEIISIAEESLNLSEKLHSELPDSLQVELSCALCHNLLGFIYLNDARYREALSEFDIASQMLEKSGADSGLSEIENVLAQVYNNYGLAYTTIKSENENILIRLEGNIAKRDLEDWLVQVIAECKDNVVILSEWLHLLPGDFKDEDEEYDNGPDGDYDDVFDEAENGEDTTDDDEFVDSDNLVEYLNNWLNEVNEIESKTNALKKSAIENLKNATVDKALVYYKKALEIAKRQVLNLQTITAYALLALCDGNVGATYTLSESYEEALLHLREAISCAEKVVKENNTCSAKLDLYRLKAKLLSVYVQMNEYGSETQKLVRESIRELNSLKKEWDLENLDATFAEVYLNALGMSAENPDLFEKSEMYEIYSNLLEIYKNAAQSSGAGLMDYSMILFSFIGYIKDNNPQRNNEVFTRLNELLALVRTMDEIDLPDILDLRNTALAMMIDEYNNRNLKDSKEYVSLLLEKSDILARLSDKSEVVSENYLDDEDEGIDKEDFSSFMALRILNDSMLCQYEALSHPLCPVEQKNDIISDLYIKSRAVKDIPKFKQTAQKIYDEMKEVLLSTEEGRLFLEIIDE